MPDMRSITPRTGALGNRLLADGRELVLYQQLFGWQLTLGEVGSDGYEHAWAFPSSVGIEAAHAFHVWDGRGDPPGHWARYSNSRLEEHRRRRYNAAGDLVEEFVGR